MHLVIILQAGSWVHDRLNSSTEHTCDFYSTVVVDVVVSVVINIITILSLTKVYYVASFPV